MNSRAPIKKPDQQSDVLTALQDIAYRVHAGRAQAWAELQAVVAGNFIPGHLTTNEIRNMTAMLKGAK